MNQQDQNRPDEEQARRGAEGAMGDGGDPAGASDGEVGPGLEKELREGGLGQALASVAGQPGLAHQEDQTSKASEEAKTEAGAEIPAKE